MVPKGAKYYVSQTKKLYVKKLFVPMIKSGGFGPGYGVTKGIYSRID